MLVRVTNGELQWLRDQETLIFFGIDKCLNSDLHLFGKAFAFFATR